MTETRKDTIKGLAEMLVRRWSEKGVEAIVEIAKEYPKEVEISFNSYCYECYDDIPIDKMKWNKSFYKTIKQEIENKKQVA